MAVRGCGGSRPLPFEHHAGEKAARRIGRQQQAVGHARIAVTEILGEIRHLRAIGIADEERRAAGEQRHRDDDGMLGDIAHGLHDIGEAAHRALRRRRRAAKARTIGRVHQPQHERQIEHGVEQNAVRRPEREQNDAADRRADQHADIARGGVEPHRAHQIGGADDVVEQQLVRRLPQHAGAAVDHQQHHGVPHLQRAGDEEVAPAERRGDEQAHAALDEAARIEAIGERAAGNREQQKRQPMRHHGEAAPEPANGISGTAPSS